MSGIYVQSVFLKRLSAGSVHEHRPRGPNPLVVLGAWQEVLTQDGLKAATLKFSRNRLSALRGPACLQLKRPVVPVFSRYTFAICDWLSYRKGNITKNVPPWPRSRPCSYSEYLKSDILSISESVTD